MTTSHTKMFHRQNRCVPKKNLTHQNRHLRHRRHIRRISPSNRPSSHESLLDPRRSMNALVVRLGVSIILPLWRGIFQNMLGTNQMEITNQNRVISRLVRETRINLWLIGFLILTSSNAFRTSVVILGLPKWNLNLYHWRAPTWQGPFP